jgi:hypothetical protein
VVNAGARQPPRAFRQAERPHIFPAIVDGGAWFSSSHYRACGENKKGLGVAEALMFGRYTY